MGNFEFNTYLLVSEMSYQKNYLYNYSQSVATNDRISGK